MTGYRLSARAAQAEAKWQTDAERKAITPLISGWQSGVVFTQLLHKLAISGSASYLHALDNRGGYQLPAGNAKDAIGYTLSAGYLLLPKTFLTPTSFARLTDCAVDKLIKFTQAINRINAAISHNTLISSWLIVLLL